MRCSQAISTLLWDTLYCCQQLQLCRLAIRPFHLLLTCCAYPAHSVSIVYRRRSCHIAFLCASKWRAGAMNFPAVLMLCMGQ